MESKPLKFNKNYLIHKEGYITNKTTNSKIKSYITNSGYLQVNITSKHIHRYIHRLLAEAFIDNPKKYRCVNHIDGNKLNNNLENLEWCSNSQNKIHAYHILGIKPHNIKLTLTQANDVRKLIGKKTQKEIARLFNVSEMVVSRIRHNKQLEYKI